MAYFRVFAALAFALVQLVSSQEETCPKYHYCKISTPAPSCNYGTDENNPCPGGRPSCYTNNQTSPAAVSSCCCIKYDPKYLHLPTGSPKPPLVENKVRLYFMQYCPYCHRVGLALLAKKIPTDIVYVNLKKKPDWFSNLGGVVPILETKDGYINGSLIIPDYLDETYPTQGELYPKDTLLKAIDRIFVEDFTKMVPSIFSNIVTGSGFKNQTELPDLIKKFDDATIWMANELKRRGTKFFAGNEKPGMVDLMMWPWIERLPVIELFYPTAYNYSKAFGDLAPWITLMLEAEPVKLYGMAPQLYYEYFQSVRINNADPAYNLLAEAPK